MKNANVPVWTSFLLGQDQETVTPDGKKLLTDTPEAIWAGEMYKKIMRECRPSGCGRVQLERVPDQLHAGQDRMWLDGVGFSAAAVRSEGVEDHRHVGFGLMPTGPKAHYCAMFTDAIGIPAKSKNKEAAYLYCQWATSKQMAEPGERGGGASPAVDLLRSPSW